MKIKNILSMILLATALTSCDLTKSPEDSLSPDSYFSSAAQLELWTQGYYSQLEGPSMVASNADDNVDNSLGDVLMGQRSAADESGWNWSMLRKINYYFENNYRCKDASVRAPYDAESYFMRAYFYFLKVRRYGDVPYYDKVIKDNETELLKKKRDDRGYVMDRVIQDLDSAIKYGKKTKDIAKVTKWTALALKSRAALYEGTWRKYRGMGNADKYLQIAADAADEFIKSSGYKIYSTGTDPYRTLFNSTNAVADEVVLARLYSTAAGVMHGIQFAIKNERQGFTKRYMNHYLMKDGTFFSAQEGYDKMGFVQEVSNRDPRLAQTVLTPGYIQTGASAVTPNGLNALTGYQPIKYVGASAYDGDNKAFSDFPLFRAAEVYLNFAEAKAELGTLTQADLDKSVNMIRKRVNMPALELAKANAEIDPLMLEYYPNVSAGANRGVILEIRRERTVELAMEGFRLWDLFRWKEGAQLTKQFYGCYFPGPGEYDMDGDGKNDLLLYTTSKGTWKGTAKQIGKDVILTEETSGYIHALPKITVNWNETRDYLWPIPADQRVLTGGALSQNPGWDDSTNFN